MIKNKFSIFKIFLILGSIFLYSFIKSNNSIKIENSDSSTQEIKISFNRFVKTFLKEYDTIKFDEETSYTGKNLNETDFTWTKKIHFKKKTYFLDEEGKKYFKRFSLICFSYKDSLSCDKAFDSYLQNYGSMGIPIKRNVNFKSFQSPPIYTIVSKNQIFVLNIHCEYIKNDDEWPSIILKLRDFVDEFYVRLFELECGCGGPINWRK